jgi:50S ribosome-binding GTPase
MRALTSSEVLVADKLFATLDTTVRALKPETKPRVLVSDTVGFIKKLPHDLVASFRSTLAEALEASLLLFVVDASDPTYESQLEVSRNVLREIGAEVVPSRLLLNKIDRVSEADRAALRAKHPDAILLSAKSPADVAIAILGASGRPSLGRSLILSAERSSSSTRLLRSGESGPPCGVPSHARADQPVLHHPGRRRCSLLSRAGSGCDCGPPCGVSGKHHVECRPTRQ